MSENNANDVVVTPWHVWLIGVVALLWNFGGAMDYFMTQTRNEEYMSAFTAEQLEFFYGMPTWAVGTWAIAVWGSVLGTLLLLMRRGYAVWVFLASLIAMSLTAFQNYALSNGMEIMGDSFALGFTATIFLISIALFLYARAMHARNVLI